MNTCLDCFASPCICKALERVAEIRGDMDKRAVAELNKVAKDDEIRGKKIVDLLSADGVRLWTVKPVNVTELMKDIKHVNSKALEASVQPVSEQEKAKIMMIYNWAVAYFEPAPTQHLKFSDIYDYYLRCNVANVGLIFMNKVEFSRCLAAAISSAHHRYNGQSCYAIRPKY